MFGSDIKQLVVLDDIRDKLDMVDSDIIPETCSHPVVTGIENTPTSIKSDTGASYAGAYTTFPLSPLQGRVHYIKDSFINCSLDVAFSVAVASNVPKDIVLAVGPRDTASIFSQVQFMIDNNPIWTTTYQHVESAIDMAGLPASVVDHSPNYATIDKLLSNKQTPMQYITIPAGNYAGANGKTFNYNLSFQFSIDLNRLSVPLSNLAFITSNMGNLRIRCYFNNFHQCFFVMQLPSSFIPAGINAGAFTQTLQASSLVSLDPVPWGIVTKDASNNWTFSKPYMLKAPFLDTIALNDTVANTTRTAISTYNTAAALIPIQFILKQAGPAPFMQVTQAQICQTCFDIKEESYVTLCEYFKQSGKVILPIQAWSTAVFNNGTITAGDKVPSSLVANIPGNNITAIAVTASVIDAQSCIVNPYRSQFQAILDGKTLNNIPYDKVDGRAIQDFTNACVDTDHEEINTDYLYSLQFPQFYANGVSRLSSPQQYFYTTDENNTTYELTAFSTQGYSQGIAGINYQKNPNLFMYVFQTAIPDSFHTGMCIIENSNRQALFRFTSTDSPVAAADFLKRFYQTAGTKINAAGSAITLPGGDSPIYPAMPNYTNNTLQFNVSCLCDECIVLDYDARANTCIGGYLSFSKPYLADE